MVLLVESKESPVKRTLKIEAGICLQPGFQLVALAHLEPKRATCAFTCWAIARSFSAVLLVIQVCPDGRSGRFWDCFVI